MGRPMDISKLYTSTDEELQELLEQYKEELEEDTSVYESALEDYEISKENVLFIEEEIKNTIRSRK